MNYGMFGSIYGNFAIHKKTGKVYKVKYNKWLDTKYWKLQNETVSKRIKKEYNAFPKQA